MAQNEILASAQVSAQETVKACLSINAGSAAALVGVISQLIGKGEYNPVADALIPSVMWFVYGAAVAIVGQTFVGIPATVIAQETSDGSMRVLASFASEGMSLRRHVETAVKPWLNANARQCTILGTFEKIDGHTEWDLIQILEDAIGGSWQTADSEWEARRDAVLDLVGKAAPATFRPALQIDSIDARLLIEALSGRWSFQNDRREKRTVWYHIADAFSFIVSTMAPMPSNEKITVISNYNR